MALLIVLLIAVAVTATALWWARRHLVRVTVRGQSMQPTLNHGDVVLVRRTATRGLRPGQLVVAEPPPDQRLSEPATDRAERVEAAPPQWLVKRVAALRLNDGPGLGDEKLRRALTPGTAYLLGDNKRHSYDSRAVGPFPVDRLIGVVICRLREAPAGTPEPNQLTHPEPTG